MVGKYSETPPYGHLVITAAWQNGQTFSFKKKPLLIPVNAAILFWPIGDRTEILKVDTKQLLTSTVASLNIVIDDLFTPQIHL